MRKADVHTNRCSRLKEDKLANRAEWGQFWDRRYSKEGGGQTIGRHSRPFLCPDAKSTGPTMDKQASGRQTSSADSPDMKKRAAGNVCSRTGRASVPDAVQPPRETLATVLIRKLFRWNQGNQAGLSKIKFSQSILHWSSIFPSGDSATRLMTLLLAEQTNIRGRERPGEIRHVDRTRGDLKAFHVQRGFPSSQLSVIRGNV